MRSFGLAPALVAVLALWGIAFAAAGVAASAEYRIHAGDVLELSVVGVPELSSRSTVSPDGLAAFPLVDDIPAAGRTLAEVRNDLRATLSRVAAPRQTGAGIDDMVAFTPSQINLTIAEYRPIFVSGDVATPGAHAYRIEMTAREALAVAGGIPALEPEAALSAQAEYAAVLVDLARQQVRLERLRAEHAGTGSPWSALSDPQDDAKSAQAGPEALGSAESGLVRLEAEQLHNRQEAIAAEKAFLAAAIESTQHHLALLRERREREAASLADDEFEFEKIRKLFSEGLTVASRLTDSRRNVLLSATQLLQTDASIASEELEAMELQRRIARLDETRRETLLEEMQETEAEVQSLQMRMIYLAQQVAQLGLGSEGNRSLEALILKIHRRTNGAVSSINADLDTELKPGDVLEVTLPGPAGARLSSTELR